MAENKCRFIRVNEDEACCSMPPQINGLCFAHCCEDEVMLHIASLEKQIASALETKDHALSLLFRLSSFVGYAACHGDKCRLPHCVSCYGDDAYMESGLEAIESEIAEFRKSIDAARDGEG